MSKLLDLFSLQGKVVVITGATGLLGRKHAEAVACSGGTPILLDLSQQVVDGLVNNAANNPKVEDSKKVNFSRLENFPLNIWNDDIAVGLTGSFLCAKHYGFAISNCLEIPFVK